MVEQRIAELQLRHEARRQRHPDQRQPANGERRHRPRRRPGEAGKVPDMRALIGDADACQGHEQAALDHGVVEHVEQAGGKAGGRAERQAEHHVADLRDRGIGQRAAHIRLEHGLEAARYHRGDPERCDDIGKAGLLEGIVRPEDGEEVAHEGIQRDLGRGCREEHRDEARRIGIGIRQPLVQRPHRRLEAEADYDEGERHLHRAVAGQVRQLRRDVVHVQRAGRGIQEGDADHIEGGPDCAHHQIVERRGKRAPVAPGTIGHEHIGGNRADLEEHEHVERIARRHHAAEAAETEQEGRIEQRPLRRADLRGNRWPGQDHGQRSDGSDQQHDHGVERVDPEFDAQRRRPVAMRIADDAAGRGLDQRQHDHRAEQRGHRRGDADDPACPSRRNQRRQRRRHQRDHDEQGRRMPDRPVGRRGQHGFENHAAASRRSFSCSSSCARAVSISMVRMSSASIVP